MKNIHNINLNNHKFDMRLSGSKFVKWSNEEPENNWWKCSICDVVICYDNDECWKIYTIKQGWIKPEDIDSCNDCLIQNIIE